MHGNLSGDFCGSAVAARDRRAVLPAGEPRRQCDGCAGRTDDRARMGRTDCRFFFRRMKGRLLVSPSFYVFWAVFCLLDTQNILPVFALAAMLHELGHAAAIACLGGSIRCVRLHAAGAVIMQGTPLSGGRECVVALAGPVTGLLAAVAFAYFRQPIEAGANLVLSLFNLLPIVPLDGGIAVRSLLGLLPPTAARVGCRILYGSSVLTAFALAVFGGVLLWQTGSNPAGLSVGICLLGSHADLLRDARKYAIITKNEIG